MALVPEQGRLEPERRGAFLSIRTHDFEEFRYKADGWKMEFQRTSRGVPTIECSALLTPSLHLAWVRHSGGYCGQGFAPQGHIAFVLPLDHRPMVYRGRVLDPLDIGVCHLGCGYEIVNRYGSEQLVASASEAILGQCPIIVQGEASLVHGPWDRLQFPDATSRLRFVSAVQAVLTETQRQPCLLAIPQAVSLLQKRFLEAVLLLNTAKPHYRDAPGRERVARLAYRYLLDSEDVPSISMVCLLTGASYATLERGFEEVYGMAPHMCIREIRLARARNDLRNPNKGTTVTAVALKWGFLELGRFSVQYRKRFDESPSETLRKARGDSYSTSELLCPGMGCEA